MVDRFEYLRNILVRLSIPTECHELVLAAYQKISKEDIEYVLCAYEDENVEFCAMLNNWQYINSRYKIRPFLGDLLFSLLMCQKLEELYEKKGYSKEMFIRTATGISYTVIECHLIKKEWGTFVAWWFDDFFRLRRFGFGRLQFELTHFGYTYINHGKVFTPTTRCLFLHIPRTGERLYPKEVDASIKEALAFFRPMFNNKPIIIKCESWVLFSKTIEFLDKDSNLYKFAKRFNIFKQKEFDNISDMWRLFDDEVYVSDPNQFEAGGIIKQIIELGKLKADTSLRRRYLEYLKQGGKIGEGVGFFIA